MGTAGASAAKARAVVRRILNNIGRAGTEVFPKQDRLEPGQYGNFINAPLFGPLVPQGRSVFLDPDNALLPYPDQWALLASVERISEDGLDRCLPQLSPPASALESDGTRGASARSACAEVRSATPCGYALPPCARRMLAGVTGYQRVSCFRLAIHLKRVGLPMDLVVALLKAWAAKNQPPHGLVITEQEIVDQTRWAYERNYRSYGCDDPAIRPHCDPSCPVDGGPVASVAGCVGRQNGRDRIGQEQKSS